ncbi:MAG: 3-oxoacyl-ACP reductase FabG [Oscillospiraceae bacterium]|jgi:3-oxoacyl-[acyl-carrier protein] reductase|nr:3-oxoacyl-ACP reductase FabG [Oscillospiraceae bacterium]
MRALVTGGSRGIGAACVRALAADGYEVVVNYNESRSAAETLARELGCETIRADVRDTAAVGKMFARAGDVDALVCCAGIAKTGLITDLSEDEWQAVIDVNVGGTVRCCRAAIPYMTRKKAGCIVTVSSVWGVTGASCEAVYAASKAAVIGLTKSLAKELGPSGIRVNCVAPGVIDTEMNALLTDADIAALRAATPLGAIGRPSDVAHLVRFLASDSARFITGQVIGADGGFPY